MPQYKYQEIKNKPSRYKLDGKQYKKQIVCNDIKGVIAEGLVIKTGVVPVSNWSLASEIKRLIDINTIVDDEPEYSYHYESCSVNMLNPFDNPKDFYKRWKSSSNSPKFQCKKCKKITNVRPDQRECFSYHQKRNDILIQLFKQLISRTPVTRTIELLDIGSSTYYNKLELLYKRCLEFLEKYETEAFNHRHFDTLTLTTDKFIYYLNNIRKKGHAKEYTYKEKPVFQTNIIATVDSKSRYAFRTDVAFDYDITADDIEKDVEMYKEDHLYNFARKNAKYRYSYYNIENENSNVETADDDDIDKSGLALRKDYLDGFHVNSSYTAYAHYWLIKDMINVDTINFVSDEDNSLLNSIMRVYNEDIKLGNVNVFTSRVNKKLSRKDAYKQYQDSVDNLHKWQEFMELKGSLKDAAISKLEYELSNHNIYDYVSLKGKQYPISSNNPIEHPYPSKDEGIRYVNCVTNLSSLSSLEMAELLFKVDSRSVNTYFNQIRRRISILERPLSSGRGEGKSYIYANFNPKYTQHVLTILRTYLNFCETYKYKGEEVTPAMILGITNKPFTLRDIVYLK